MSTFTNFWKGLTGQQQANFTNYSKPLNIGKPAAKSANNNNWRWNENKANAPSPTAPGVSKPMNNGNKRNNIYTRKIGQWKSNVAAGKINVSPYNYSAKRKANEKTRLQRALAGDANALKGIYSNDVGLRGMMASPGYYGNWNTSRNKNVLREAARIRRQQAVNASAAFKMRSDPAYLKKVEERADFLRSRTAKERAEIEAQKAAREAAAARSQGAAQVARGPVGNMRHTASKAKARRNRRTRRN